MVYNYSFSGMLYLCWEARHFSRSALGIESNLPALFTDSAFSLYGMPSICNVTHVQLLVLRLGGPELRYNGLTLQLMGYGLVEDGGLKIRKQHHEREIKFRGGVGTTGWGIHSCF